MVVRVRQESLGCSRSKVCVRPDPMPEILLQRATEHRNGRPSSIEGIKDERAPFAQRAVGVDRIWVSRTPQFRRRFLQVATFALHDAKQGAIIARGMPSEGVQISGAEKRQGLREAPPSDQERLALPVAGEKGPAAERLDQCIERRRHCADHNTKRRSRAPGTTSWPWAGQRGTCRRRRRRRRPCRWRGRSAASRSPPACR